MVLIVHKYDIVIDQIPDVENGSNKRLIFFIFAYAIGTFIFGAEILMKPTISIIAFYIIVLLLIICTMLALYNNYKKDKFKYIYLPKIT